MAFNIDVVQVDRIDVTKAERGYLYLVSGRTVAGAAVQFSTHDSERADLCDWSKRSQLPIEIVWRKRGYGRELLAVRHPQDGAHV